MERSFFSHCPLCHCTQTQAVESCKRCGAQLLLLAKLRFTAHALQNSGRTDAARALYRPDKNDKRYER